MIFDTLMIFDALTIAGMLTAALSGGFIMALVGQQGTGSYTRGRHASPRFQ